MKNDKNFQLIIYQIIHLNNAKFGSFCEFVFENVFQNEKIERQHFDRTDFKLNNTYVDVKGKRNLKKKFIFPSVYQGNKLPQIRYILVEFFVDVVIISENKKILNSLGYRKIKNLFDKWSIKTKKDNPKNSPNLSIIKSMKNDINDFFKLHNLQSRIIYRTCQTLFGNESPDNLFPKNHSKSEVTVFLNFKDQRIDYDNFLEIIVFRNFDAKQFELIKNPRLDMKKIDTQKINSKYKFKDIDDLKSNWIKKLGDKTLFKTYEVKSIKFRH